MKANNGKKKNVHNLCLRNYIPVRCKMVLFRICIVDESLRLNKLKICIGILVFLGNWAILKSTIIFCDLHE